MSRDLPDHPNLDHLKKQAKALLRALRERNSAATLADALHALAREYGFPSWPKMKAHIEALPAPTEAKPAQPEPSRPQLFPRMTAVARRALFFSRYEAAEAGRLRIRPEHVLLGVVRGASGAARTLIAGAGITLDDARAAVIDPNEPREVIGEYTQIPFESETQILFRVAAGEADALGHQPITTAHVLLALLHEPGASASYLTARGVTPDAAREAAVSAAADEASDSGMSIP